MSDGWLVVCAIGISLVGLALHNWLNWDEVVRGTPEEPRPSKFVAWYRPPFGNVEYIREDDTGRMGVRTIEAATRFHTEAEARKRVPVYDGSADTEVRGGIYKVRG